MHGTSTDGNCAPDPTREPHGSARPGRSDAARLRAAPRCGARTRAGTPCRSPAVRGRTRCRMHGGAAGSGAPRGNRNALTHGFHTAAARAGRRRLTAFIAGMEAAVAELEAGQRKRGRRG